MNKTLDNVREWVTWVFRLSTDSQVHILCIVIWQIWFHRNKTMHDGKHFKGYDIANSVRKYIRELDSLRES